MVIKVNDLSIIQEQQEQIPRAGHLAEQYLRTLAGKVQDLGPPVSMDLDTVQPHRSLGGGSRLCLVITPTDPRLKRYPTAHYAIPMGNMLNIGYWLLGGEYQNGRSIGIGRIGAVTDADVSNVLAIVQAVLDYAIGPTMNEIADLAAGGGQQQSSSGFFGS